jgi:sugar/nucleoside kinase (ribokinase family)
VNRSGRIVDSTSFRARRLCVVGNVNRDLRVAPIPAGNYLFQDGETSTALVRETLGGGGANSAVFAALLGAKVNFAGKVGADPLAARLRQALRAAGVRPYLAVDRLRPTGTSINLVYDTGRRHFVSHLPSSAALAATDVDDAALRGCDHLLRADVWFSEAMLFDGNAKLLGRAKARGMRTSLDVNWDPQWGHAAAARVADRKRAVRKVLPLVDLVHGNVRELCTFAGATGLAAALRAIAGWGAGAIVVHMGGGGAGYYAGGKFVSAPAARARRVVNATGTGDLLSVIMILLHQRGVAVREKLRAANRTVADYVAGVGPFSRERGAIE